MLISSIVGLFLGYFIWDYKYLFENDKCDTIIDIYYPDSISVNQLNLNHVDCPFTLNNCGNCNEYYIADKLGNRYDPISITPCNLDSCKIYYLSRNDYDITKKWFNSKNLVFNFPKYSLNEIYNYEK